MLGALEEAEDVSVLRRRCCAFPPRPTPALSVDSTSARYPACEPSRRTGECLHTFAAHSNRIDSVALGADGHIAMTAGRDGTVRAWELDWDYDFPLLSEIPRRRGESMRTMKLTHGNRVPS
jgi:WD40 repeat protein